MLTTGRGQTSKLCYSFFAKINLNMKLQCLVIHAVLASSVVLNGTEGHRRRFRLRNVTCLLRDDVTGIREVLHMRNEDDRQQRGNKIIQIRSGLKQMAVIGQ
jgi:hypothetical protein